MSDEPSPLFEYKPEKPRSRVWVRGTAAMAVLALLLVVVEVVAYIAQGRAWRIYTPENSGLTDATVNAVALDAQGRLWVSTPRGLNVRTEQGQWIVLVFSNANQTVYTLAPDVRGWMWGGTEQGVSKLILGANDQVTQQSYPINNKVNALAVDSLQRLWVGTPYGLYLLDPEQALTEKVSSEEVIAIALDSSDQVLVLTPRSIMKGSIKDGWLSNYVSLQQNTTVYDMVVDHSNQVWVATDKGLYWASSRYPSGNLYPAIGITSDPVFALAVDPQGLVWAAAERELSFMVEDAKWVNYTSPDYSGALVTDLAASADSGVWMSTPYGLLSAVTSPARQGMLTLVSAVRGPLQLLLFLLSLLWILLLNPKPDPQSGSTSILTPKTEKILAKRVYWWSLFSPFITIPCLGILYLNVTLFQNRSDNSSLAWLAYAPLALSVPLLLGLNSKSRFVYRHTQQGLGLMLLRAGVAALALGGASGVNYGLFILGNGCLWFVGSLWGLNQVSNGSSWLMLRRGEGALLELQKSPIHELQPDQSVQPGALQVASATPDGAPDPGLAWERGNTLLKQGHKPAAVTNFLEVYRHGSPELRQKVLQVMADLDEIETF